MRLETRPLPNLQYADIIPYYWRPSVWVRTCRPRFDAPVNGFEGRIGPLGFAVRFRPDGGRFHNGSKWLILFRYNRYVEEMCL